ncbi:tetratricopeptide repeat protein [Colwellia sp. RE-S-Sl-9]
MSLVIANEVDDWSGSLSKANKLLAEKQYLPAFNEYKIYADKDNGLAQFSLALLLKNGWGKPANIKEACYWYNKAANNGIPMAQQELGDCYLQGIIGDKKQALVWYEAAYKSGIASAACQAGELYLAGEYVPLNKEKGLALCVQAANSGAVSAMTSLGKWYFNGQYVEKNISLAFQVFQDAANKHSAEAAYYVAQYYDRGIQREISIKDALYWYEKSASRGFKKAYLPTSALYLKTFEEDNTDKKGKLLAKTYLWAKTSIELITEPQDKQLATLILNKVNTEMPPQWQADLNAKVKEHVDLFK